MPEQQFKRHIAYKQRIGALLSGQPVIENERFLYLNAGEKQIIRVNVVGNIVDKYENQGEKKYSFFTLDDGSGQIKLKVFGEDADKFSRVTQGQTVLVIGVLRSFNNEVYVSPEIIRKIDARYLLVRKIEIEKIDSQKYISQSPEIKRKQFLDAKDKILELIKNSEENSGITVEELSLKLSISQEIINQEIQKLLENGTIFEPRPGKLRWLG